MCGFESNMSIVLRGGSAFKMGSLESTRVGDALGVDAGTETRGVGRGVEIDVEGDVDPYRIGDGKALCFRGSTVAFFAATLLGSV